MTISGELIALNELSFDPNIDKFQFGVFTPLYPAWGIVESAILPDGCQWALQN